MILTYEVYNYKILNTKSILDFTLAYNHKNLEGIYTLQEYDNTGILPLCTVFGSTNSGKSTILNSLKCLFTYLHTGCLPKENYSHCTQKDKPTTFKLIFEVNNIIYRYYLAIKGNVVLTEYLHKLDDHTTILYHTCNNVCIDYKHNFFLQFLSENKNINNINDIYEFITNIYTSFYNSNIENILTIINNTVLQQKLITELRNIDTSIENIFIDKTNENEILLTYKCGDYKYTEPLKYASNGTKHILNILSKFLIESIKKNTLIVIPNFDAYLASSQIEYLLQFFLYDIDNSKKQLIIEMHTSSILDTDWVRPDEVYFMDKCSSNIYITQLCSYECALEEYKNNNIGKMYRDGRFGGSPFILGLLNDYNNYKNLIKNNKEK